LSEDKPAKQAKEVSMRDRFLRRPRAAASSAIGILLLASVCAAQGPSSSSGSGYVPKRTPDGQPDFQGYYNGRGGSTSIEPDIRTSEVGAYDGVWSQDRRGPRAEGRWPQVFVDGKPSPIPMQPWARAQKQANLAKITEGNLVSSSQELDTVSRCLPADPPRSNLTYGYNGYQILQPPGHVVILSEWNHLYRIIPLDGRPHVSDKIRLWMGDSRGHWEGNTLVVDTTNSNGRAWIDMAGTFHSDQYHLVERFTMTDANTINIETTITDPKVFTSPWKLVQVFDRAAPDYELFEYACTEGNRLVDNAVKKN
jgi:hypothetical protein